jgi:hypothetical protein
MDYLYDKVGFYDTLKKIMQGKGKVSELVSIHSEVSDIAPYMLHFLENHDEQRIASPDFAGSAEKGKPALAVSALISASPTLLYFGQDVGEDGSEETGFGDPTRTSIFDYVGVPAHQRFMNNGKFDGGGSTNDELALREFYEDVMAIVSSNSAIKGDFVNLHDLNLSVEGSAYSEQQFAFARINEQKGFVVVANFEEREVDNITLSIPKTLISESAPSQALTALLSHEDIVINDNGEHFTAELTLKGLETKVFAF